MALTWEKAYVNGLETVPWGSSTAVSVLDGVYPDLGVKKGTMTDIEWYTSREDVELLRGNFVQVRDLDTKVLGNNFFWCVSKPIS